MLNFQSAIRKNLSRKSKKDDLPALLYTIDQYKLEKKLQPVFFKFSVMKSVKIANFAHQSLFLAFLCFLWVCSQFKAIVVILWFVIYSVCSMEELNILIQISPNLYKMCGDCAV